MNKRTMQEVVAEFNKLSGQKIKRFATVEIGEKRIAAFEKGHTAAAKPAAQAKVKRPAITNKPIKSKSWELTRVSVDGVRYNSVIKAFVALGLPVKDHGRFRLSLKASGKETIEHNGKKHNFVIIKKE